LGNSYGIYDANYLGDNRKRAKKATHDFALEMAQIVNGALSSLLTLLQLSGASLGSGHPV
jgi:hypothetical protein